MMMICQCSATDLEPPPRRINGVLPQCFTVSPLSSTQEIAGEGILPTDVIPILDMVSEHNDRHIVSQVATATLFEVGVEQISRETVCRMEREAC